MPTSLPSGKRRMQRASATATRRGRPGSHEPRQSRGGPKAPARRSGAGRGHPGGNR